MLVAQLHSGVAGHITTQLFLIHSAVGVVQQGVIGQVGLGHIQSNELHVGIELGHLYNRGAEREARHYNYVIAIHHSGIHHGHTVSGGIASGLLVGEVHTVGGTELLAGLIRGLVKGLVGDVAIVGNHGHPELSVSGGLVVGGLVIGSLRGGSGGVLVHRRRGAGGTAAGIAAAGRQSKDQRKGQEQCSQFLSVFQ